MSGPDRVTDGPLVIGVLVLVLVSIAAGAAAGAAGDPRPAAEEPETDNTVTRIELREDGSARWTVTIRTRLDANESVAKYEAFQERFRANRSAFLERFREPMERVVSRAGNATGRPMATTNFSATTSIRTVPRRWGVVTYAFTWHGFARVEGERLHVGDAFQSGFFIAANDSLQLRAPEGYGFAMLDPAPDERDDRTATWFGRVDFGEGQPAATLAPAEDGATNGPSDGGVPVGATLALLVLLVGGALAVVGYRRKATAGDQSDDGAPPDDGGRAPSAPPVEAPMADDERVRRILRARGGQMRQSEIVDEVEWSKSKVSRVVADLAEQGTVEKVRLGRENVVSLVDEHAGERAGRD